MKRRFLFYGIVGWVTEVLFTGVCSLFSGSLTLSSQTYLWMFPIYGMAVFLEPIHDRIRHIPWLIRGFIWASLILSFEYLCGWTLESLIGVCPWDYRKTTAYSINGYIRLDYLPIWFMAGLIFERIHNFLDRGKIRVQ